MREFWIKKETSKMVFVSIFDTFLSRQDDDDEEEEEEDPVVVAVGPRNV